MSPKRLQGKRIAFLAADGVEKVELEQPRAVLEDAGAQTELLSLKTGEIQTRNHDLEPAGTIRVNRAVAGANVVDDEVVVDANVITSRSPRDLPAFCSAIVETFAHEPSGA